MVKEELNALNLYLFAMGTKLKIFSSVLLSEVSMKTQGKHFFMPNCPDDLVLLKEFVCFYFINTISHISCLFCYGHWEALNESCGLMLKIQEFQLHHINRDNANNHLFNWNHVPGVFHKSS